MPTLQIGGKQVSDIEIGGKTVSSIAVDGVVIYEKSSAVNYLTFTAEQAGSTIGLYNDSNSPNIEYSLDNGATWQTWDYSTITLANVGDTVMFQGNNPNGLNMQDIHYSQFTMTGQIAASGSVMTLISVPEPTAIPQNSNGCFTMLFYGCTAMTSAPELPATTLAPNCYWMMFEGCTGLTESPVLPASVPAAGCYSEMFLGCTNLESVEVHLDSWSSEGTPVAYDMLLNTSSNGILYNMGSGNPTTGTHYIPSTWTILYSKEFYIKNEYAGTNTMTLTVYGTPATTDFSWSLDKTTWTQFTLSGTPTVSIPQDGYLYLRSSTGLNAQGSNRIEIACDHEFSIGGGIGNLIDYTSRVTAIPNYSLYSLFEDASVTDASKVDCSSITSIGVSGLQGMFNRCTLLKVGLDLKTVTAVGEYGMAGLYTNCSTLESVVAPNVSAWNPDPNDVYSPMFGYWLSNVSDTGIVYAPAGLSIPRNHSGIPSGWTRVNY